MAAHIGDDGIIVWKGGRKRLDTRDKFLHGNTYGFPIHGSKFIAAVPSGAAGRKNSIDVYDIAAAPSGHTHVYGVAKFDLNNNSAGLAFDRWHCVTGSGAILWLMDGESNILTGLGGNVPMGQFVSYRFRVNAGRVEMVRRLYCHGFGAATYTVLSHNIYYQLRTGLFT